nr:NADH dehydrogenase subunit 5 [Systasis sp. 1 HHL-2023a]
MYYILSMIFLLMLSIYMFINSIIFLFLKLNMFLEWNILFLNSLNMNMYMYIDWMTLIFLSIVTLISSMIMLYCKEYMSHDIYNYRFFLLVMMFILSMMLMIISPSMISILLGWDGLGLISYCLVIYYQSFYSFNSGMLTVLINRIGDVLIILSISFMLTMGFWNFLMMNNLNMYLLLMIILASFTKSAQFPFSSWLPAAMAAPTPVSSLVHSSTLVTAGVYLLIRFNFLIYKFFYLMNLMFILGLMTMMKAGLSANFEYDFKKIIAYSTLSQLGLMIMIYSIGFFELSFFHLVIHAIFKSMMFMCSGVVIHSMLDYQDIRFLSNLKNYYPFSSNLFLISNLSLCGMPFFSGFFSKDKILEILFMNSMNLFSYLFMMVGTGLTVSYSIRLLYFLMNKNFMFLKLFNFKEFKIMNFSMIMLMILSILFGFLLNWMLFNNIEYIYLMFWEKNSILLFCLLFFFIGKINFLNKNVKVKYFMFYSGKMWFIYKLNYLFFYFFVYSKFYNNLFDKGWSEFFVKNSVKNFFYFLNKFLLIKNNFIVMLMILMINFCLILMIF